MNRIALLGAAAMAAVLGVASSPRESSAATHGSSPNVEPTLRKAPVVDRLRFVENAGQMRDDVAFAAFGRGHRASLSSEAMTIALGDASRAAVEFTFDGARHVKPRGESPTRAMFHYFHGKDGAQHPRHARTFSSVAYDEPWPGVDLAFDARASAIEYSLVVHPGAEVGAARFRVRGAEQVERTESGELSVTTSAGALKQSRPVAWQEIDGARKPVDVAFDVGPRSDDGSWTYGFAIGAHDAASDVVIDPTIQTDDFPLGFSGQESAAAIAIDDAGNVFVVAHVSTPSLVPGGKPAFDSTISGNFDGFVGKYDSGGNLLWASFLGSSADYDYPSDVAVDSGGRPVVTGWSNGEGFPTTPGFSTGFTYGAFVVRFAADGASLVHANTFGSYQPSPVPVALTADGTAFVASVGTDRFTSTKAVIGTPGPHDFTWVAKISPTGHLDYLTEMWADASPYGRYASGIAVNAAGQVFVTGSTSGAGSLPPADATGPYGGSVFDAYAMKLDPTGTKLDYAVFLGGSGDDIAGAVAVDSGGAAYVVGETNSTVATFPRVPIDDGQAGVVDQNGSFVVKISPTGQNREFTLALRNNSTASPYNMNAFYGAAFDEKGRLWASYSGNTVRLTQDGQTADVYGSIGTGRPSIRTSREIWFLGGDRALRRITDLTQGVAIPGSLSARATSSRSARVTWTSSAANATGFVVERAPATGAFVAVGSPGDSERSFEDQGLDPDTNYRYRVRAVAGTDRSAPTQSVAVRTNGSFSLHVRTARIVDSRKSRKDSVKLSATAKFETSTAFDPATDVFHLSVGTGAGAYVLNVPLGAGGWKSRPSKSWFRFSSPRGASPQIRLDVDLKKYRVTLTVTKTDLAGLPVDPAEVSIRAGDEADTDGPVWKRKGDTMTAR